MNYLHELSKADQGKITNQALKDQVNKSVENLEAYTKSYEKGDNMPAQEKNVFDAETANYKKLYELIQKVSPDALGKPAAAKEKKAAKEKEPAADDSKFQEWADKVEKEMTKRTGLSKNDWYDEKVLRETFTESIQTPEEYVSQHIKKYDLTDLSESEYGLPKTDKPKDEPVPTADLSDPKQRLDYWIKYAKDKLVGKNVRSISLFTSEEEQQLGWMESPILIEFTDNSYIFASGDDEGNYPGSTSKLKSTDLQIYGPYATPKGAVTGVSYPELVRLNSWAKYKTVESVRYMTAAEMDHFGIYNSPLIITIGGHEFWSMRDPEGNDGGAWFGGHGEEQWTFPVLSGSEPLNDQKATPLWVPGQASSWMQWKRGVEDVKANTKGIKVSETNSTDLMAYLAGTKAKEYLKMRMEGLKADPVEISVSKAGKDKQPEPNTTDKKPGKRKDSKEVAEIKKICGKVKGKAMFFKGDDGSWIEAKIERIDPHGEADSHWVIHFYPKNTAKKLDHPLASDNLSPNQVREFCEGKKVKTYTMTKPKAKVVTNPDIALDKINECKEMLRAMRMEKAEKDPPKPPKIESEFTTASKSFANKMFDVVERKKGVKPAVAQKVQEIIMKAENDIRELLFGKSAKLAAETSQAISSAFNKRFYKADPNITEYEWKDSRGNLKIKDHVKWKTDGSKLHRGNVKGFFKEGSETYAIITIDKSGDVAVANADKLSHNPAENETWYQPFAEFPGETLSVMGDEYLFNTEKEAKAWFKKHKNDIPGLVDHSDPELAMMVGISKWHIEDGLPMVEKDIMDEPYSGSIFIDIAETAYRKGLQQFYGGDSRSDIADFISDTVAAQGHKNVYSYLGDEGYSLAEAVADLAYTSGVDQHKMDLTRYVQEAINFERMHHGIEWGVDDELPSGKPLPYGEEYIDAIDAHYQATIGKKKDTKKSKAQTEREYAAYQDEESQDKLKKEIENWMDSANMPLNVESRAAALHHMMDQINQMDDPNEAHFPTAFESYQDSLEK